MTNQENIERLAVEVMGWKNRGNGMWYDKEGKYLAFEHWNPFVNISDAWMLVEKMPQFTLERLIGKWKVSWFDGVNAHTVTAETVPEAISNAVLEAIGVEVE